MITKRAPSLSSKLLQNTLSLSLKGLLIERGENEMKRARVGRIYR
jgi:hypothetical protein